MTVRICGELRPIGPDMHFTEVTTSMQDKLAGDALAYVIGDLFIDFNDLAPTEQWTRVAKALRVHGFKISF